MGETAPRGSRVGFYSDDEALVSGTADGGLFLWSTTDGARIRTMGASALCEYAGDLSHSPLVLVGHMKTIRTTHGESGEETGRLPIRSTLDAAFSPNGQKAVTVGVDEVVRMWNVERIQPSRESNSHGALSSVHFSEDGSILMAASVDGVVTLWDRWKGQVLREVRDLPKRVARHDHPDGTHAAWAGWSGTLHIHSFPSTRRQVSVQAHLRAIVSLEFNPDSSAIATEVTMDMPKSGGLMAGSFAISIPEGGLYLRWRFPPNGKSGGYDQSGRGLHLGREERQRTAIRGGAQRLCVRTGLVSGRANHRVWYPFLQSVGVGAGTGNAPREIPAPGRLNGLSFHPTKSWLALACVDNTTRVVALNGEVIGAYAGHQAEVNAIDFSRDGRWVTSVGDDGRIRTWEIETGEPLWRTRGIGGNPLRSLSQRGWEGLNGKPGGFPATRIRVESGSRECPVCGIRGRSSSACFRPRDSSRHGISAQEKWKLHSSPWSRSVQRGMDVW